VRGGAGCARPSSHKSFEIAIASESFLINDFTPWNDMLQTYVDDEGQVNYAGWQRESARDLDQWLADVCPTHLEALARETAIAFLINLYNALTIQQVLQTYPIQSIRPTILGIPNWLAFLRFFTRPIYHLNGRSLSLNALEHGILRRKFSEPRIHFALVCASIGCPLLRAEAYWPDRLTAQLEEDAYRFIDNPSKVHYDTTSQTLYCSKIFKWYKADFLTVADSVAAYIYRYQTEIEMPSSVTIAYLPYSWELNQRTSS
jgi:hypothetical protein